MPDNASEFHSRLGDMLTVKEPGADLVGVAELLQEAGVLLNTLDAESLVLTSNSVHEVVVLDGNGAGIAADVGKVC